MLCGDEHRALKISQFQIKTVQDPDNPYSLIDCLAYTEHGSKNGPGGEYVESSDGGL